MGAAVSGGAETRVIASAYLAAEGFAAELAEELAGSGRRVEAWHGPLALSPDPPAPASWALDVWTAPREIEVASVKAAADALRAMQRNWSLVSALHHRRAALIADRLPPVKARPLAFPEPAPTAHLGAWTLLAPDRLLASPTKTSPFVGGAATFVEDREGPPSRAYLKLWEGLTRIGRHPLPGETCLDLGAAPGGWTWALAKLGAQVTAVDKAPLDPRVAAMPGVVHRQESAFGLDPQREPAVDWLFSDVICYPDRLLGLVHRWREAGRAARVFCSVKFQGTTDHAAAAAFAALPGAQLFHSAHNKHELTCAIL
jgi:23S rRNA (cytidine2498-2'-O)-methyltransferase